MFIIKLLSLHVSDHHYAHHQESKTAYYCMWCSALVVLAVCTVEINQQDATNLMFITKLLSLHVSGQHYAHHQERKTVYYCMWCSALVVLAVCTVEINQQDATNPMFIIKPSISTCFGPSLCPIIRRTRPCITAYGVLHWLCWPWLCAAGS